MHTSKLNIIITALILIAASAGLLADPPQASAGGARPAPKHYPGPLNMQPPAIASDATVKYDYPIVYVRAPRRGDKEATHWPDVNNPVSIEPGSDLMLLRPDGT